MRRTDKVSCEIVSSSGEGDMLKKKEKEICWPPINISEKKK